MILEEDNSVVRLVFMAIHYESDKKIIKLLNESIDFGGKRVLDVGCGDGAITIPLAAATERTVGIDPDIERTTSARENAPSDLDGRLEFIDTSIDEYNFADTSSPYDIALYLWSL